MLADALEAFANTTGYQLVYRTEVAAGLTTQGADAGLSAKDTLRQLLRGTGLAFAFVNDRTIAIYKASDSVPPQLIPSKPDVNDNSGTAHSGAAGNVRDTGDITVTHRGLLSRIAGAFSLVITSMASGTDASNISPDNSQSAKLDEIVVTAQKRDERLKDVPISISVLSGKDLDGSGVVGVTEALSLVPGVVATTNTQGGGTFIAIRGVTSSGPIFSGGSPVGYYLDSVPFSLVKSAIAPDFDAYDLQRVEVLRGPQGTLYGANSENGLVRVLTNDADLNNYEFKARTSVSSTDGGGGNYRGDMAVNVPIIDGKLAARLVLGYQDQSGWIDNQVQTHTNDAVLRNYRLKINAQPTDELSIALSAWRSDDSYGAPSISDANRFYAGSIAQPISTLTDAYGVKIGYVFPAFTISSMSSYLRYTNNSNLDLTPIGVTENLVTDFQSREFAQEVIVNSSPSSVWRWTAGGFYRDGLDLQYQVLPVVLPAPINYSNGSRSYAGFGEIGRRFFGDQLEWTLGARYFHDDVLNRENSSDLGLPNAPLYQATPSFNSTTPRAVLTWYPNPDLTVYASFSEGFRSGFPQDSNVIEAAPQFPPVKPDKLYNYEIGTKGDALGKRISFESAVYYIDWKDVQQDLLVPLPGSNVAITALVNGQGASGVGVDGALTVRPTEGLDFGINFNWNDLAFDGPTYSGGQLLFAKGDRLNYSSKNTDGAFADYSFPLASTGLKGQLSASANYISKQAVHLMTGSGVLINTGDSLVNVRSSFAVMSTRGWTAKLFVDNLTNRYDGSPEIATSDAASPSLIPRSRPRTIGVQLEYSFKERAQ